MIVLCKHGQSFEELLFLVFAAIHPKGDIPGSALF